MSRNFLKTLIDCSEKAGNIARKCRADENLLALLIEEKSIEEANPRFVKDFKTLADVLIQETVRYDLAKLFPEMKDNIIGEETATFTNTLGESVTIAIGESEQETSACLEKILNGNKKCADLLASEVHKEVEYVGSGPTIPMSPSDLNYNKIGLWIDPIDATAEYIAGDTVFTNFPGITSSGLDCVTILIGVYNIQNGTTLAGIINQPFAEKTGENTYTGRLYWGVSLGCFSASNVPNTGPPTKIAVVSASEHPDIVERIKSLGYEVAVTAGAGHKALKVITGQADVFVLSKSTTFKWDTCAPQAILQAVSGGIFDFRKSVKMERLMPIVYDCSKTLKCNLGGLIAVRNPKIGQEILKALAAD